MSVTFEVNDWYFWWKMSLVLTICHIIRLYKGEYCSVHWQKYILIYRCNCIEFLVILFVLHWNTETETAICNYIAAWFLLKNIFSASKLGQSFHRSKNLQGQNSKIIAGFFSLTISNSTYVRCVPEAVEGPKIWGANNSPTIIDYRFLLLFYFLFRQNLG